MLTVYQAGQRHARSLRWMNLASRAQGKGWGRSRKVDSWTPAATARVGFFPLAEIRT